MAYRHRSRKRHASNPKRRRHHVKYMVVGRKYSHNPRHRKHYGRRRHYRGNPATAMMGTSMKHLLPMVLSVSAGVISVDAIPLLLSRFMPTFGTGVLNYVAKAGAIVGGGMVAKRIGGKDAQVAFIAGGVGKILLDFVGNTIIGTIASVAPAAAPAPATAGYGMIQEQGLGRIQDQLGAFYEQDTIY